MSSPQQRIAKALERIADELQAIGDESRRPKTTPFPQYPTTTPPAWNPQQPVRVDCGCPNNHACMNTACPRAPRITC